MTIRHLQGQCVSCGREAPWPHVADCPYCGEEVLMPRLWVALRRAWFATVAGTLGMMVLFPLMNGTFIRFRPLESTWGWIGIGIAFMLFLLPHDDRNVMVCSQRELVSWQLKSALGSLLLGIASLTCAVHAIAAFPDKAQFALCSAAMLCLLVSPWFFRLCAWRLWTGMALVWFGFVWV